MKSHKRGKDEINENVKTDADGHAPAEDNAGQPSDSDTSEEESFEQKYAAIFERYQRTLAEFDNYRKRTTKEKAAMYDDGLREVVEKLLPVIDNFERALNAGDNKEDKFYQGVVMIARQFGAFLTDLGVEPINAEPGEIFNHHLHFAVAHVEDTEYGNQVIVNELQKGYKHKDKVIRPSMVRVAN